MVEAHPVDQRNMWLAYFSDGHLDELEQEESVHSLFGRFRHAHDLFLRLKGDISAESRNCGYCGTDPTPLPQSSASHLDLPQVFFPEDPVIAAQQVLVSYVVIYEHYQFEGEAERLTCASPYFRPVSCRKSFPFTECNDYHAQDILNLIKEGAHPDAVYYEDLLCEYGTIFFIASVLPEAHPHPWIGFQRSQSLWNDLALEENAVRVMVEAMAEARYGMDVLYFWDDGALTGNTPPNTGFYEACDTVYNGKCSLAFSVTFAYIFEDTCAMQGVQALANLVDNTCLTSLPPIPASQMEGWAYNSYWTMSTNNFKKYVEFARKFLVAVDAIYFPNHHDQKKCILMDDQVAATHCWCPLLERLVNVWAYHMGMKMVHVDGVSGEMTEWHPVEERVMWQAKLLNGSVSVARNHILDTSERSRDLYNLLGAMRSNYQPEAQR
eukprot:TRINITY_DN999_c0_g1_i1.p1 TRINITY_DN999_c0_g1~~TRINITY_DN999_c0_g1_i1.p1  ORF type:complete len:477 (+),score=108.10 TRINITY_DN999_c0_g1_i1:122-1432(+)